MGNRIRVNTESLKQGAAELAQLAAEFDKLGSSLYGSIAPLNDYGGQLPNKKTALLVRQEAQGVRIEIAEMDESLRRLAAMFEQADQASQYVFLGWGDWLKERLGWLAVFLWGAPAKTLAPPPMTFTPIFPMTIPPTPMEEAETPTEVFPKSGDIQPGSPEAIELLSRLMMQDIKPGSRETDLLNSLLDVQRIVPGSPEEERMVRWVEENYGISFQGKWSDENRLMIAAAVIDVGDAFGGELDMNGPEAFQAVYRTGPDHPLFFLKGTTITDEIGDKNLQIYGAGNIISVGGFTTNSHLINFASMSPDFITGRNNAAHELFHAFADRWIPGNGDYSWPPEKPDCEITQVPYLLRQDLYSDYGFSGHTAKSFQISPWRQHPPFKHDLSPGAGEYMADMFLGWVYDEWPGPGSSEEDLRVGDLRAEYMRENMPHWLREAVEMGH